MYQSIVTQAVPKLKELMRSDRSSRCEIAYVDSRVRTRGTISPDEIEHLYTHKLFYALVPTKELLGVLNASSISKIMGDTEVRISLTFLDYDNQILYSIYANRFGCTKGKYEGNTIAIDGAFGPWLYKIVKRCFSDDTF